ncbi:MAG: hypothetical protein K9J17_05540 [Flavobacteriales bacterium]|nr:hypothetical protein [Flavobacteriales bacterium]
MAASGNTFWEAVWSVFKLTGRLILWLFTAMLRLLAFVLNSIENLIRLILD